MWDLLSYVKNNQVITISYEIYWRKGWDSNPRYPCRHAGFQDRCLKPLGHPSMVTRSSTWRPEDQEQGGNWTHTCRHGPRKPPSRHELKGTCRPSAVMDRSSANRQPSRER